MNKYIAFLVIILSLSPVLSGQKLINSPYSRFGPGIIEQPGMFRTRSMGGAAIAIRDPLTINYLNPASFSVVDTNSFVFDFGLEYQANMLTDADESYISDDVNFHHVALAIPITRWMGFATGFVPYSNGYYSMVETVSEVNPDYNPILGETQNNHKGNGNYNKYFMGIGLNPIRNLSLGASITFLFGEIERDNLYLFLDDNNQFNNLATETINISGFNFDLGAQYTASFGEDYFATAGFSMSTQRDYSADYERLFSRYSLYQTSFYSTDTLEYVQNEDIQVSLPGSMGFGLAFGKKDKFTATIDYIMTDYDKLRFFGYEDYFVSSKTTRFGAEIIPDKDANYNYLNRVEYRLGGHISDGHLMVNGERLNEFGITFGAGLPLGGPLGRSKSRINLHVEYINRKGSYDLGLHGENYLNVGVSLNFYDYWFIKQKYN